MNKGNTVLSRLLLLFVSVMIFSAACSYDNVQAETSSIESEVSSFEGSVQSSDTMSPSSAEGIKEDEAQQSKHDTQEISSSPPHTESSISSEPVGTADNPVINNSSPQPKQETAETYNIDQHITLTYQNAIRIIGEKDFENREDVEKILQLISNQTHLPDDDYQIIKRAGGALFSVTIHDQEKISEFSVFSAIPESLNYEVTVIIKKEDNNRTYADVDTFAQLKQMLET